MKFYITSIETDEEGNRALNVKAGADSLKDAEDQVRERLPDGEYQILKVMRAKVVKSPPPPVRSRVDFGPPSSQRVRGTTESPTE